MVSIVMTVHNRRTQLLNTLKSIEYFVRDREIRVIIVDDTNIESESLRDFSFRNFNIPIEYVRMPDIQYTCSCIAYNVGFNLVKGDVVIIQNAECMWMGDILTCAEISCTDKRYLTFGAFSFDTFLPAFERFDEEYDSLYSRVMNSPDTYPKGRSGWFNHTKYRPCNFHFCSAMTRNTLERLNGFDERYKDGFAHDDAEILVRIDNMGIKPEIIDSPFVIHQWHENQGTAKHHPLWQKNFHLYNTCTLQENLVKAPKNTIYVR